MCNQCNDTGVLAYDPQGQQLKCPCNEVKRYAMKQSNVNGYVCNLIQGIYDGYTWFHVFASKAGDLPFSAGFDDIGHAKKYYNWMRQAVKIQSGGVK
jgi:hypothetical protein